MTTAHDLTQQLIDRAKNLQKFTVERYWNEIPLHGVVRFDVQHTQGSEYGRIFVHALTQKEAEEMVDEWFEDMRNED